MPAWTACFMFILSSICSLISVASGYAFIRDPAEDLQKSQSPGLRSHDKIRVYQAPSFDGFRNCSIENFLNTGLPFLDTASPISLEEFNKRRERLVAVLDSEKIDAFVVEPGYAFQYYANVSQYDWEPWEPEERPFLMVVKPRRDSSGRLHAETWFLAPEFEAERVRLLNMPVDDPLNILTWKEHWNPYETLFDSKVFRRAVSENERPPKVMVDEEMRDFIQRGLSNHGFQVVGLGKDAEQVRQIKSRQEIEILRAVNTGTVEAVRQMRRCLHRGLSEDQVRDVLDDTLQAGGLEPFFDIVLFDEDASNPHGGTGGTKRLGDETMVLIDVGAHLYGYSSDISRTFFPPYVSNLAIDEFSEQRSPNVEEKSKVWEIVFQAQTASARMMRESYSAASIDIAARDIIDKAGYGQYFTHRVGHSIGIKAHESPYLNKGNINTTLIHGMTFTSEPGIYLVNKFGVRHEDVFLVRNDQEAEVLSGDRAKDPWNP